MKASTLLPHVHSLVSAAQVNIRQLPCGTSALLDTKEH